MPVVSRCSSHPLALRAVWAESYCRWTHHVTGREMQQLWDYFTGDHFYNSLSFFLHSIPEHRNLHLSNSSCLSNISSAKSIYVAFQGGKKKKRRERERGVLVRACIQVFHRLKGVLEHGQVWTITAVCEHVSAYLHTGVNVSGGAAYICVLPIWSRRPWALSRTAAHQFRRPALPAPSDLGCRKAAGSCGWSKAPSSPVRRDCREDSVRWSHREKAE